MSKESINAFLMACRNTPHATTGIAPATMMLKPNTESRVEPRLAAARDRKGSEKKMSTFDEDQPIQFKEDKASPWGSGKLVAINGPVSYGVQDDNGRERRGERKSDTHRPGFESEVTLPDSPVEHIEDESVPPRRSTWTRRRPVLPYDSYLRKGEM
ncbi:hypothetical protein ACOME3_002543 [Neoechinorhynchus agilis]